MKCEWKTYQVGDLCSSISETYKGKDEYVVLINTSDVLEGKILNHSLTSNVNLKGQFKKKFQTKDILYSEIRPANKRFAFVDIEDTQNYIASTKLMVIRANAEIIMPEYLFIFLQMPTVIAELQMLAETRSGTFPQITFSSEISPLNISLPDKGTQNRIVEIFCSLDDKIELNNKINENLLEQADLLYDQIFSDEKIFTELGNVIETTSGGTPPRKHPELYENPSICWVKSKELNGGFIHTTEEMINEIALSKSAAKMLPAHCVLVAMYGATVGEYGIIVSPMTCNQAVCALIPNNRYPYPYLYELIRHSKEKLKNMAVGSAQQNISQVLIKQLPIHTNLDKVEQFAEATIASFQMIETLTLENIHLAFIRDTLLPKLMNGEIKLDEF